MIAHLVSDKKDITQNITQSLGNVLLIALIFGLLWLTYNNWNTASKNHHG